VAHGGSRGIAGVG